MGYYLRHVATIVNSPKVRTCVRCAVLGGLLAGLRSGHHGPEWENVRTVQHDNVRRCWSPRLGSISTHLRTHWTSSRPWLLLVSWRVLRSRRNYLCHSPRPLDQSFDERTYKCAARDHFGLCFLHSSQGRQGTCKCSPGERVNSFAGPSGSYFL